MKKINFFFFLFYFAFLSAQDVSLVILGTAQDAGAPQLGCKKKCCQKRWLNGSKEAVVSLGLVDAQTQHHFLFEATPDISNQLYALSNTDKIESSLGGIFLTHAHMGHYSGLLYLGKEAKGAQKVPVYAAARFANFLQNNGPWEQLINDKNIELRLLDLKSAIDITPSIRIQAVVVPHRDEYSETVGYIINGPQKKVLFIPDIDKWDRWEIAVEKLIVEVDYAFLDATFFDGDELPDRDMNSIPHPFVVESIKRFETLSEKNKNKIYFIHFNHTNPLLDRNSEASISILEKGYHIARTGMKFSL